MDNIQYACRGFMLVMIILFYPASLFSQITLLECQKKARDNYLLSDKHYIGKLIQEYSVKDINTEAYFPKVTILGQAHLQNETIELPNMLQKLLVGMNESISGISKDQYRISLQVNQPLWDGGVSTGAKQIVRIQSQIETLSREISFTQITKKITQIFFNILILEASLESSHNTYQFLSVHFDAACQSKNNGILSQSDLDKIHIALLEQEKLQDQLKNEIQTQRGILSLLIGEEIGYGTALEKPISPQLDNQNHKLELDVLDFKIKLIEAQKQNINRSVLPRIDAFFQGWYGKPGLNLFKDITDNRFSLNMSLGLRFHWNVSSLYLKRNKLRTIGLKAQEIRMQKDDFLKEQTIIESKIKGDISRLTSLIKKDDEVILLYQSIKRSAKGKHLNGIITTSELLRDVFNESNALLQKEIHELSRLKARYELKELFN